jgi:hypothetical protein
MEINGTVYDILHNKGGEIWTQMKNTDKDPVFIRFIGVHPVHQWLNSVKLLRYPDSIGRLAPDPEISAAGANFKIHPRPTHRHQPLSPGSFFAPLFAPFCG